MKKRRIYFIGDSGRCFETPFAKCADGNIVNARITSKKPVSKSLVISKGFPLVSKSEMSQLINSKNNGMKPYAVVQSESPDGMRGAARLEHGSPSAGDSVLTITLKNEGAAAQTLVIGDGHNLISRKLGLGQLPASVVVSGTYGVTSLADIKSITKPNPFDVHSLQIASQTLTGTPAVVDANGDVTTAANITAVTTSDKFFVEGEFSKVRVKLPFQTVTDGKIDFSFDLDDGSFRNDIRKRKNFRDMWDGFSGAKVVLPAMTCVTISVKLSAAGLAYGMRKVGGGGCY